MELQNYRSLGHFFDTAFDKYYDAIFLDEAEWSERETIVPKLLKQFTEIAGHIEKLGLFARNEEIEEVKTGELKFLLVPFIVGQLNSQDMDMETRLDSLKACLIHFRMFVIQASAYDLAEEADLAAFNREPTVKLTPSEARDERIERLKRVDSLLGKVKALRKRLIMLGSGTEDDEDGVAGVDEETHRALMIAMVKHCVGRVLQEASTVEQELPMLEEMSKRAKETPAQQQLRAQRDAEAAEASKNKKPFVLQIKDPSELRNMYRDRVLQPFIELPTMTLAEIADKEMKMETEILGQKLQPEEIENMIFNINPGYQIEEAAEDDREADRARQRVEDVVMRGTARVIKDDANAWDEDKRARDDLLDEEEWNREYKDYEQRYWDDWKDENPRGAGNKMVNRG